MAVVKRLRGRFLHVVQSVGRVEMSAINLSFRGVGVDVIVCDVTAWISALRHLLLVGGTGVVLVGLFACVRCVVRVACWTARCILLRRLVISFRTLLPS